MVIPDPRFERRATLVLLDEQDRILLCGGCCHPWTVPEVRLPEGVDVLSAARQHVRRILGEVDYWVGPVQGARWPEPHGNWDREVRSASRVLVLRLRGSARPEAPARARHVWWPPEELHAHQRAIRPQGVVTFLDGYLGGWLPDGIVRLE